jgi:predicted dehydrogenase
MLLVVDVGAPRPTLVVVAARIDRRHFLARTSLVAAAPLVRPAWGVRGFPSRRLALASIGVGGKGWSDLHDCSREQADVVAICDVDAEHLAKAQADYPLAIPFSDWRALLDRHDIEAVTISTPDHMHAPIAMRAIESGRHVFCQKPLTHSVHEARALALAASRARVVTQMGNQHRSGVQFKRVREAVRSGAIGAVRVAHVWTDRPIWPQGIARPKSDGAPPPTLDWDAWLGVAPERAWAPGYHPFAWRGFWDFGTGALGDMGCHSIDPVFWSLDLGAPEWIEAESEGGNDESAPTASIVRYSFPASGTQPPLRLCWYDGGKLPEREELGILGARELPKNGVVFLGEQGSLFVSFDAGPVLFTTDGFFDVDLPDIVADDHAMQWTRACLGEGRTVSPFSEAGALTELVLLGNVALRVGRRIEWDPFLLRASNAPEADRYLRRSYREGWQVTGL